MKRIFLFLFVFTLVFPLDCVNADKKWWKKWPRFPKGLRITAEQVKLVQHSGERVIFVYSGYEGGEGDEVVCGSLIIPYLKVPPFADGSTVRLRIPKNCWIMCF
jgi:hypothetical protein